MELQTLTDVLIKMRQPVPELDNAFTIYSPNKAAGTWIAIAKNQPESKYPNRWTVALYCPQGLIHTICHEAAGPDDAVSLAALWLRTTDRYSWFLTDIGALEAEIIEKSYPSKILKDNCTRYDHEFENGNERFFVITTQVYGELVYYDATEQTSPNPDKPCFAGWTKRGTQPGDPYRFIAEYLKETAGQSWQEVLDEQIARKSAIMNTIIEDEQPAQAQPSNNAFNTLAPVDGFTNYPTFAVAVELKNDAKLIARARTLITNANTNGHHPPSVVQDWYLSDVIKLDNHDNHPLYSFASFALDLVRWVEVVEFLTQV